MTTLTIGLYLSNQPLQKSCQAQSNGSCKERCLVWDLHQAELTALAKAKELCPGKITAITLGQAPPQDLLRKALALGATEAIHIGGEDWPANPSPQLMAAALKPVLANFDLVFLADLSAGNQSWDLPLKLAMALDRPGFSGVLALEATPQGFALKRRLEQGRRQKLRVKAPAVIGFLPDEELELDADCAARLKAAVAPILQYPQSYGLLKTTTSAYLPQLSWQRAAALPATKKNRRPDPKQKADQRLDALVTGFAPPRSRTLVQGSAQECSRAIFQVLLQEEFLPEA